MATTVSLLFIIIAYERQCKARAVGRILLRREVDAVVDVAMLGYRSKGRLVIRARCACISAS